MRGDRDLWKLAGGGGVGRKVLEEAINLESGPIRDANPLVPPAQPRPPTARLLRS